MANGSGWTLTGEVWVGARGALGIIQVTLGTRLPLDERSILAKSMSRGNATHSLDTLSTPSLVRANSADGSRPHNITTA